MTNEESNTVFDWLYSLVNGTLTLNSNKESKGDNKLLLSTAKSKCLPNYVANQMQHPSCHMNASPYCYIFQFFNTDAKQKREKT